MPHLLPNTFQLWEKALCRRFLMIETESGDAVPIRSFEITPSTLASAVGADDFADREAATAAFRQAFDLGATYAALEHGHYARLTRVGLPGCFGYLALTLLVDALLDEEIVELGAFRAKLRSFLGVDRSFSNLGGVARMWTDLRTWLDAARAEGHPFRSLELPPIPRTWTHIGYTLRLSFPSGRDRRFVGRFLDEHPTLVSRPRDFLDEFGNAVAGGPDVSWGMKEAFKEFRQEYLQGRRALASHRFWTLVQALALGRVAVAPPVELSIEMMRDEDDAWMFVVFADGRDLQEPFESLGSTVGRAQALVPHELAAALDRGIIVFRQTGLARWRAVGSLSDCVGRVMIGLSEETARKLGDRLGKLVRSGSWLLTGDRVPVGVVEDVLARVGLTTAGDDRIVPAVVFGGIRTGPHWLGRPTYLPRISADRSELHVDAPFQSDARCWCEEEETAPGTYRLRADRPLDGRFTFGPATSPGEATPWSRTLSFVSDALVHPASKYVQRGEEVREWEDVLTASAKPVAFVPSQEDTSGKLDDLVEAVYAGGASGWDEFKLVSLVREACPPANPWDLLRSLQESTLITPRLRPQWKGRVWSLNPAALVSLPSADQRACIVQGCLGARLQQQFIDAATGAGGTPFRRKGVSDWAPPLLGCVNVDIELVAERLGWPLAESFIPGPRKLAFKATARRPDGYDLVSRWSWTRRRFAAADASPRGAVDLTRWAHRGGRDHDIYLVATPDKNTYLLSRAAAVSLAHSAAGVPLFSWVNGTLVRTAADGALPDALAAALRLRHAANSGVTADFSAYAYPAEPADARNILRVLPNMVQGFEDSAGTALSGPISSARHSGGRVRLVWKSGRLTTTNV